MAAFRVWVSEHKGLFIGLCVLLFFIILIIYANVTTGGETSLTDTDDPEAEATATLSPEEIAAQREQELKNEEDAIYMDVGIDPEVGTDLYLAKAQENLRNKYGMPPTGFIWDLSGEAISLGDKEMSSEEVVYAYIQALSKLDFSSVQKYTRGSSVVDTYKGYFNSTVKYADYADQFDRNMYKEALLSLQINGIGNSAVFADNQRVYTINVSMLDLTDKDFWRVDQEALFNELYKFGTTEDDDTKLDSYLYEYILRHYQSVNAPRRELSFDLTVERYPDINTGWLISIDMDVDMACKYRDGKVVVDYIKDLFRDYQIQRKIDEQEIIRNGGTLNEYVPSGLLDNEEQLGYSLGGSDQNAVQDAITEPVPEVVPEELPPEEVPVEEGVVE